MPGLADLLGENSTVRQIFVWGVANSLIGALLEPYVQELSNLANSETQAVPLSPADAARLVVRGYYAIDDAINEAKKSGISPDNFRLLVEGTGNPPSPDELAVALRRGIIPEDDPNPETPSFRGGIRAGDLQDRWADVIKALSTALPSPGDALDALLEGQIDQQTALDLFKKFGGDPDYFQMLFDTRGSAPTPVEAATMANRGIIPWTGTGPDATSFEQAFLEGPWRNKWLGPYQKAAAYYPPPRTITALVREGGITDDQAVKLWMEEGLSQELATIYLDNAKQGKTASAKDLTVSTIGDLYEEKAISADQASTMLQALGYDASEAQFILTARDLSSVRTSLNRALTSIHGDYIARRISRDVASAAIDQLGVAAAQRDQLLGIWDLEYQSKVALLTPTQIATAAKKLIIGADEAEQRLVDLGYTQDDAEIFLALHDVGPLVPGATAG